MLSWSAWSGSHIGCQIFGLHLRWCWLQSSIITRHVICIHQRQYQKVKQTERHRARLTIRGPHTNVRWGPFSHTLSQDFLWWCTFPEELTFLKLSLRLSLQ